MSRRGVAWLASCAAGPWLLAAGWNLLDRRAHIVDRAIRLLTVWRD